LWGFVMRDYEQQVSETWSATTATMKLPQFRAIR
jgi:hypothetical protein